MIELAPHELSVEIRVRPGYRRTEPFEWVVIGQLLALPSIYFLSHAEIQLTELDDGIRCRIKLPKEGRAIAFIRRVLTWPFTLYKAKGALQASHHALQRQHKALQDEVDRRIQVEFILRAEMDARIQAEARREEFQQQLQASQKLESIGTMAGGIAHDFNNYLVVMHGNAELALNLADPESRQAHFLRQVTEAAAQAGLLTQQLLTFSRKNMTRRRNLEINDVVRSMHRMLQPLLPETIELQLQQGQGLGPVWADFGLMGQVIINLALNARDAMPDGGVLRVETKQVYLEANSIGVPGRFSPGEYLSLTVSDTGTGMSAEVQDQIFEPFFTTRPEGKGTGLGLAVVHGIVDQYDGFLQVSSAPGEGTSIRVFLPIVDGASDPVASQATPALPGGTERILFAEDNDGVRELTLEVLEEVGYQVDTARDGVEALAHIERTSLPYDLALLDITMPKADGREVRDSLLAKFPTCTVLFMSGYAGPERNQLGLGPGVKMLSKPFGSGELLRQIRSLIDPPQ